MQGKIIGNISNTYKIKTENKEYESFARGKFKKDEITPLVGDNVEITLTDEEKNTAVIEKILPRKNELKRPKISNIDQIVFIVSTKNPKPDLLMLDKQLVYVENLKIEPIIVINKMDLEENYKGSFKYLGSTDSDTIKLEYVNYNYQLLESNYIMTNDNQTYNNFVAIKNSLSDYHVYLNAYGLYQNNTLNEVKIIINKSYFKRAEILNMTNVIINNLNNFDSNIEIKIYFKSNNVIKAFINKSSSETKINTYILEE